MLVMVLLILETNEQSQLGVTALSKLCIYVDVFIRVGLKSGRWWEFIIHVARTLSTLGEYINYV